MSSLFDLPRGDDEQLGRPSSKRSQFIRLWVSIIVGVAIASSLAASITIGSGEALELGQRRYNVGTCAESSVQIQPKTVTISGTTYLTQLTVTGINPIACDNTRIRLSPYDSNPANGVQSALLTIDTNDADSEPDQSYIDIFASGGEFRASNGGAVTSTTDTLLRLTSGSTSIRVSTYHPPETSTAITVFSGGQGKTLKSSEDVISGWAISFQVRLDPGAALATGRSYGRTDIQLESIPGN